MTDFGWSLFRTPCAAKRYPENHLPSSKPLARFPPMSSSTLHHIPKLRRIDFAVPATRPYNGDRCTRSFRPPGICPAHPAMLASFVDPWGHPTSHLSIARSTAMVFLPHHRRGRRPRNPVLRESVCRLPEIAFFMRRRSGWLLRAAGRARVASSGGVVVDWPLAPRHILHPQSRNHPVLQASRTYFIPPLIDLAVIPPPPHDKRIQSQSGQPADAPSDFPATF
ncbi:hypothetical protein R3P38DRAFT_192325 [Favolaschia claudopus]|uniref:Uncharacterized protein n=1 Tax=Favolaschia claudopus TaxID=2862362 RepID=A0AAV9ZVJ3_9AGAR